MNLRNGDVFEISHCTKCDKSIEHQWWGVSGTVWVHKDTQLSECEPPKEATPDKSTRVRVRCGPGGCVQPHTCGAVV